MLSYHYSKLPCPGSRSRIADSADQPCFRTPRLQQNWAAGRRKILAVIYSVVKNGVEIFHYIFKDLWKSDRYIFSQLESY